MLHAVDEGSIEDIKKLLSCTKYTNVRDACGRTLLHRALLRQQRDTVLHLLEECPHNLSIGDNVRIKIIDISINFSTFKP